MKFSAWLGLGGCVFWLTGCQMMTKVTVLAPIGPALSTASRTETEGGLQVYSARQPAYVDVNTEATLWNNDFGKNDFLFSSGHTDYLLYGRDGTLIQRVHNDLRSLDSVPAVIPLPAGTYQIEAESEDHGATEKVRVPVVIEGGLTTVVHLMGDWKPKPACKEQEIVRLPNGDIAGWRARL